MKTFILIVLVTFSCSNVNTSPYLKSLKFFKGDLVDHFPRSHKGLLGFYSLDPDSNSVITGKGSYIKAIFEYDKISQLILDNAESLSKYLPNDTCQLVVFGIQEMIDKRNCVCKTMPIPNFIIEVDRYHLLGDDFNIDDVDLQHIKLPNDFEYYVDAKRGTFIEKEHLFESLEMPDCWKHGYSKGYAISKKRNLVIIWLEIW